MDVSKNIFIPSSKNCFKNLQLFKDVHKETNEWDKTTFSN